MPHSTRLYGGQRHTEHGSLLTGIPVPPWPDLLETTHVVQKVCSHRDRAALFCKAQAREDPAARAKPPGREAQAADPSGSPRDPLDRGRPAAPPHK